MENIGEENEDGLGHDTYDDFRWVSRVVVEKAKVPGDGMDGDAKGKNGEGSGMKKMVFWVSRAPIQRAFIIVSPITPTLLDSEVKQAATRPQLWIRSNYCFIIPTQIWL